MESKLHLDAETDVPLGQLDAAPWNPKAVISGSYRTGLKSSLEWLGVRERLKLFPNPKNKGRFYVINGNQRLDIIYEHILNLKIKEHFSLDHSISDSAFRKIKESEDNQSVIAKLRKSLPVHMVPCQIITQLDENTKFTLDDAKQFSLVWDRNAAKTDEVKQADVYREVIKNRLSTIAEDKQKEFESRIKAMVRPELPVVQPAKKAMSEQSGSFEFADPGTFQPTEEQPWGPTPPEPAKSSSGSVATQKQSEQLIPLVLSLTQSGYENITDSILRSKSRLFREYTLKTALESLEKLLPDDLDAQIDSIVVETALSIVDKHIEIEEDNYEESESEE
jgi:hypothetical protein